MKSSFIALLATACIVTAAFGKGSSSSGTVHVGGYTRKDGTYVAPHERSAPNNTKSDNWSTKGNVNPYTGKAGTQSTTNSPASSTAVPASPKPTTSAAPTARPSTDKSKPAMANVSLIKVGMSKAQVIAALGKPNIEGANMWAYVGAGIVRFAADTVVQVEELKH